MWYPTKYYGVSCDWRLRNSTSKTVKDNRTTVPLTVPSRGLYPREGRTCGCTEYHWMSLREVKDSSGNLVSCTFKVSVKFVRY